MRGETIAREGERGATGHGAGDWPDLTKLRQCGDGGACKGGSIAAHDRCYANSVGRHRMQEWEPACQPDDCLHLLRARGHRASRWREIGALFGREHLAALVAHVNPIIRCDERECMAHDSEIVAFVATRRAARKEHRRE